MSKEIFDLHIPDKNKMSAVFDLLIENLATQQVFFNALLSKLINISDPDLGMEQILDIIHNTSLSNKKSIEQNKKEIIAYVMTKYAE